MNNKITGLDNLQSSTKFDTFLRPWFNLMDGRSAATYEWLFKEDIEPISYQRGGKKGSPMMIEDGEMLLFDKDYDFEYEFDRDNYEALKSFIKSVPGKEGFNKGMKEGFDSFYDDLMQGVVENDDGNIVLVLNLEQLTSLNAVVRMASEDLTKNEEEAIEEENCDLTTTEFKQMEKYNLDMFNSLNEELQKFPADFRGLAPIDEGLVETLETFNTLKGAFVSHNCYGHLAGDIRYNGVDAGEYEENSAPYLMITMAENIKGIPEKLEMIIEEVTSNPNITVSSFAAGMGDRDVNSYSFGYSSEAFADLSPEEAAKVQEEFVDIITASFTRHLDRKKMPKTKQVSSKNKGK